MLLKAILEFGHLLVQRCRWNSGVLPVKPSLTDIIPRGSPSVNPDGVWKLEPLVVHPLTPQRLVGSHLCAGRHSGVRES